jgi:hypothetical protein
MARGAADDVREGVFKRLQELWGDELCAEHDGTVASFENLSHRLDDLADYRVLFERKSTNIKKVATAIGWSVGVAAVFTPIALAAAPSIAAGLGAVGILGAAGTGTAISSLTGAALTNASLAAIGGSLGMAGGTAILTAAGASLGAYHGGIISNAYFGEVRGFEIRKVREGKGTPVILIEGFLCQQSEDPSAWYKGINARYKKNPVYHVKWESKCLTDIGSIVGNGAGKTAFKEFAIRLGSRASKKAGNPLAWASLCADLLANPWHTAMVKAQLAGVLLADLIARTKTRTGFILCGHSLGARVIFYALQALSTKRRKFVKDAILLGGAVGRSDLTGWAQAANAVRGNISNCFSVNDWVLSYLYKYGTGLQSEPIGLGPIDLDSKIIINLDVTNLVGSHTQYKTALSQIMRRLSLKAKDAAVRVRSCNDTSNQIKHSPQWRAPCG